MKSWTVRAFALFVLSEALFAGASIRAPVLERMDSGGEESFRISWETHPGYEYELQASGNLKDWFTVAGYPVEAVQDRMFYDFAPTGNRNFFRVVDHGLRVREPEVEVFFSAAGPTGLEEDLTLEEKVNELLLLAEPGSQVLAAVFTWTRENMADAFIEAYRRGVDVRLIIGSDYQAVRKLETNLRAGRVRVCRDADGEPNGCHGGGINHNKFFLFSSLSDGSKDVVVQSSANLTNPQIRMNNNLVIVRNDTSLYNAYHMYGNDLDRDVDDLDYYPELYT